MVSAAGIIVATGAMTLGNDFLQAQASDPKQPVATRVNFRVIPATAIAAGLFYVLEQGVPQIAKGLAWMIFAVAFAFSAEHKGGSLGDTKEKTSPLQTLLAISGINTLESIGHIQDHKEPYLGDLA